MADYLDRVRRLSALLFLIGVFLVFAVIQVPSALPIERLPVYVILLLAAVSGLAVRLFPWRRFHPNLFLVVGLVATALVATLIHFSGGRGSIFFPLFFFIVVASGAYYTALPLALITAVASLGSLSYVLYSPFGREDLLRSAFEIATYAVTAFLTNTIFRGLERSTAEAQRAEVAAALARVREDFLQRIGHELRSPLTVIVARSDLLKSREYPSERVMRSAEQIHQAAIDLERMVSDLLDAAALERGAWRLDPGEVDLGDLVREAVDAVLPPQREPAQELKMEIDVPPGLPRLTLDRARMKQALVNVIGNAVKYSPHGGVVRVAGRAQGGGVELRISDQGVGIAPDALEKVFEKFYRAPNELARGIPGTGLGLSIVKQLVEAHGGTIRAESPGPGRGSTFVIYLPKR